MTPNADDKNMGVHRFARALHNMQRKLIDESGRTTITDELQISTFLNNIPDISKQSITPYITDNCTYNDIVNKSEQFEAANRVAHAEYNKPGYSSKVSRYTHATSTQSTYSAQEPRPDHGQQPQNHPATPGARSTASAGPKDSHWKNIKETICVKHRMRRVREKA